MHRGEAEGWGGSRNDGQGGGNSRSRKKDDPREYQTQEADPVTSTEPKSTPGGRPGSSSSVSICWVSIVSGNVVFSGFKLWSQRAYSL